MRAAFKGYSFIRQLFFKWGYWAPALKYGGEQEADLALQPSHSSKEDRQ